MTDEPEDDGLGAIEPETPETPEVWISDGEAHLANAQAFYAKYGMEGATMYEGVLCALVPGKGVVSVHDILKAYKQPASVRAIRGSEK